MEFSDRVYSKSVHARRFCRTLIVLFLLTVMCFLYSTSGARDQQMKDDLMKRLYSSTGRIVAIDKEGDTITIKAGGDIYWKYDGVRDFRLNDPVSFLVDDGGTFGVQTDDKILKLHYAGGL